MNIYSLYFKNGYKPPKQRIKINKSYLKSSPGLLRFSLIVSNIKWILNVSFDFMIFKEILEDVLSTSLMVTKA